MADRGRGGDAESTDELLYTDTKDISNVLRQDPQPLKLDHCDLLLDAIDVELGQLQVQPQNHREIFRKRNYNCADPPKWSESLSKDTGLGSTTQTNDTPLSCLDLIHTPMMEKTSERSTDCQEGPDTQEKTNKRSDRWRRDKEEMESRREQVIWRLKRLLGDTCKEDAVPGESHPPSDSICTEDFVQRFKEEMVELALPSNMQHPGKEEEAEDPEITDSDTLQKNQNGRDVLNVERRESTTPGKTSQETVTAHCSQSHMPGQQKGLEKGLRGSFGMNITHISENARQKSVDDSSISHKAVIVTVHENQQHNNSPSPKARCLAGVPVRSFDTVSIASDLDSVCTEQVRQHIDRLPGWHSLIQSVTDTDDYLTNQSDYDTLTHEESEPQPIHPSVHRSTNGSVQKRSPSVGTAQHKGRETYSDNDTDTDEEVNHWSSRCRSKRTSEKMQSDWAKMKLTDLQQKCEKEEETLRLKRAQIKDIEFCLSELRQRRKHASQELEQLTAETAQMEKEKQILESVLSDSRVERDSVSCHLDKLQKQRESCLHEIRNMEEDLETLSQHRKSLKERVVPLFHKRKGVIMSLLEREEMERQLDSAKTELFAEQRRARERLESVQEHLEETREELQRATEAENSLRSQCACLEKEQIQKKEQIEALEVQVSELQVELGECKIRVGTLEKMLAQRELQLLDFKEQCGALQAERDGLKVELQHLKTQHYRTLKEAQEQNQRISVNQQAKEEKTDALKEQTLTLTRCIESMQISIQQLKEEEIKKLRKSLEQQREEAKNREEELHVEASEKVHKAIEEERRKWEAEKVETVQMHCGILEEQNRKGLESVRSEMQQEKSKAQALQHKVLELKTRVQELESESCAQQREQDSLLAVICKSLKEEHQAELQRVKKQMAQESQRAVLQLEQAVQLAVKEAERLQVTLGERDSSHNQTTADLNQQLRHWAQELEAECQHLHLLLEQSGAKQNSVQLPTSSTMAEALTKLKALREELQDLISHLHQELDSQKQTTAQLRKDMEQEMSLQGQQLRLERDHALDSLKERLIQEHVEELSSLNRAHTSDGGVEGGGVAMSLRKQLKAKDLELRHVQRSMSQWKEQTAARLARKFEEELTAELERKTSKTRGEKQTKFDRPERELTFSAKETQNSVCSPGLHVLDSTASHSPSDLASFKLLRYLQSRVTQLRLENQAYNWSSSPPDKVPLDLSGSYLTTITQGQDNAGIQTQSAIRTLSS